MLICVICVLWVSGGLWVSFRRFRVGLVLTSLVNSEKKIKMCHHRDLQFFSYFPLSSHCRNSTEVYAASTVFSFWWNIKMMKLYQLSVTQGVSWDIPTRLPLNFDLFYTLLVLLFMSPVSMIWELQLFHPQWNWTNHNSFPFLAYFLLF